MSKSLAFFCLLLALPARAEHHRKPASTPARTEASEDIAPEDLFYRYRLNSGLGVHVQRGSGLAISGQFGYAAFGEQPIFIGPEMNFSFVANGSLFGVWAGGWYEQKLPGSPKLSLLVGAVGGPSFASQVPFLPTTTWSAYLDLGAAREIDDLAALRLQLRPGVDGGHLAFLVSATVSFRFL